MTEKSFTIKLIQNLSESDEQLQNKNSFQQQNNSPIINFQKYLIPQIQKEEFNAKIMETEEENLSFTTPEISVKKNLFVITPKCKNKKYKNSEMDKYFCNDSQKNYYQEIHEKAQVTPFELYSNHSFNSQDFSPQIIYEQTENPNQLKRCCSYLDEAILLQSPQISPKPQQNKIFPFAKAPQIVTRCNSSIEMMDQGNNTFSGLQKLQNHYLGNNKFLHNQPIEEKEQEQENFIYEENNNGSLQKENFETIKKDNELNKQNVYTDIMKSLLDDESTPPSKNNHVKSYQKINIFSTPVKIKNIENNIQSNKTLKKKYNLINSVESHKVKLTKEENKILQNDFLKQNFKVLQKIGSGVSNTKVFKIQSKIDGIIYGLKSISFKQNPALKIQMQQKLHNYMNTNCIKNNPNIIKYYQNWELDDKHIGWIMEHCSQNLYSLQNTKKRFSEVEIRTIIRDICLGLDLMHTEKLYHLNLKPENILLSKMNKYKLSDIGLALYSFNICETFQFIQSYDQRYLSLEFIQYLKFNKSSLFGQNSSINFAKVDIYALGAIIYQLCIGNIKSIYIIFIQLKGQTLPNAGEEWHQLRSNQFKKLDQLPIYSNSLKDLIKQMMNKNPQKRLTSKQILEYLPNELELELQWHRNKNNQLKKEVQDLEVQLSQKGLLKEGKGKILKSNKSFC